NGVVNAIENITGKFNSNGEITGLEMFDENVLEKVSFRINQANKKHMSLGNTTPLFIYNEESGKIVQTNFSPEREYGSTFERQFYQHNPDILQTKSLKGKSMKSVKRGNELTDADFNEGNVNNFITTKGIEPFIAIK